MSKLKPNILPALASDINSAVESTVQAVVRAKMRIGKALIEAKDHFEDPKEFTKWWELETVLQSKQEVSYCIKVAEKFGTAKALIDVTSYSALRELVTAPGEDIELLEQRAQQTGKGPSVSEAREIAKKNKSPDTGTQEPRGDLPPPPPPLTKKSAGDINLAALIAKPFHIRLGWFLKPENKAMFIKQQTHPSMWALCLFGLDCEPAHPMNPMSAAILYHEFRGEAAENHGGKKGEAYKLVVEAHDQITVSIAEFYNE